MDAVQIFPPGASQLASAWASAIQLGSWLMADPGPDYGAKGLIESVESQNALRDGGTFACRRGAIRKMALPLMINTPSPVMWESSLRRAVTPGAIVSVQPEGVPSSQAVYFDIIDGRWEPDYNIFHNRVGVRKGTLYLDTQPWGYWPTEILLASSASVGYLGQLAVNGASVIGDVPPLAHVLILPTTASFYPAATGAAFRTDMIGVSFGAGPSFQPLVPAASWVYNVPGAGAGVATLTADKYAPASQALAMYSFKTAGSWVMAFDAQIPSALEPAYRGRFRAFAFLKSQVPSTNVVFPWQIMLDAERTSGSFYGGALASSNQLATFYGDPASGMVQDNLSPGPNAYTASPAYSMFDMGELTLPPSASGMQGNLRLRLWTNTPTQNFNTATYIISFGGVYLLPVDGAAGILPRGLVAPSLTGFAPDNINVVSTQAGIEFNPNFIEGGAIVQPSGFVISDARAQYRGRSLRIGASTNSLLFVTGDRMGGRFSATYPVSQAGFEYSQVSVSYRPQFQFLAGL